MILLLTAIFASQDGVDPSVPPLLPSDIPSTRVLPTVDVVTPIIDETSIILPDDFPKAALQLCCTCAKGECRVMTIKHQMDEAKTYFPDILAENKQRAQKIFELALLKFNKHLGFTTKYLIWLAFEKEEDIAVLMAASWALTAFEAEVDGSSEQATEQDC